MSIRGTPTATANNDFMGFDNVHFHIVIVNDKRSRINHQKNTQQGESRIEQPLSGKMKMGHKIIVFENHVRCKINKYFGGNLGVGTEQYSLVSDYFLSQLPRSSPSINQCASGRHG